MNMKSEIILPHCEKGRENYLTIIEYCNTVSISACYGIGKYVASGHIFNLVKDGSKYCIYKDSQINRSVGIELTQQRECVIR